MTTFTVLSGVSVTVVCIILLLILACGTRAVVFSTKLPRPFKKLCRVVLATDLVLILLTGAQPWSYAYPYFEQEFIGTSSVLASLATTLMSLERVFALKCPLKYIRCSCDYRLTSYVAVTTYTVFLVIYMCVRLLVCYAMRYALDIRVCLPYQSYCILTSEAVFIATSSVCFALVCHVTATSRRQHTRRITRMGLPQNHALNAADTHCSAVLFVLYPCGLFLAMFSILLIYWPFIADKVILTWLSVSVRIITCTIHGAVFNFWFDEWRLHLLTLLSPLSGYLRDWAGAMRINVYNIVVAHTFDGSRLQMEGTGKSRRISRQNTLRTSTVSGNSSFFSRSVSQKSISSSVLEQVPRAQISKLEDIEETEV